MHPSIQTYIHIYSIHKIGSSHSVQNLEYIQRNIHTFTLKNDWVSGLTIGMADALSHGGYTGRQVHHVCLIFARSSPDHGSGNSVRDNGRWLLGIECMRVP